MLAPGGGGRGLILPLFEEQATSQRQRVDIRHQEAAIGVLERADDRLDADVGGDGAAGLQGDHGDEHAAHRQDQGGLHHHDAGRRADHPVQVKALPTFVADAGRHPLRSEFDISSSADCPVYHLTSSCVDSVKSM